eukprot:jgi/Orpsp1_1/1174686/evm.model.c7180000050982.1
MMKYLIEKNSDFNKKDCNEDTPLILSYKKGSIDFVKYLIDHGADMNQRDKNGKSILFYYLENENYDMVKYLIDHSTDPNQKDNNGNTPLLLSCKKENLDIVRYLISHGADINKENNEGITPLILSCILKNGNIVEYLVNSGADVNKGNIKISKINNNSALNNNETINIDIDNEIMTPINDKLWVKVNYEWRLDNFYYGNIRVLYCNEIQTINFIDLKRMQSQDNNYTYNRSSNRIYRYLGILLYESITKKFYIIFSNSDSNIKLYFGVNYKFYKLFEFAAILREYSPNNSTPIKSLYSYLKIKAYNSKDDILQTIYINMEGIEGNKFIYDKNSIFFNTGDNNKDNSNKNTLYSYSNMIKY